jgi:hypothetical protein
LAKSIRGTIYWISSSIDHVIVFNEAGLLRLMVHYRSYYSRRPLVRLGGAGKALF